MERHRRQIGPSSPTETEAEREARYFAGYRAIPDDDADSQAWCRAAIEGLRSADLDVPPASERALSFRTRAVLAAIAFLILAGVVHLGLVRSFDRQLLDAIQSIALPSLDVIGSVTSVVGQAEVTAGIALGLVVGRLRARRADFWVPLAIAVVVLVEAIAKIVVAQPSPPHELSRGFALLPGIEDPFSQSYPSGHVARDTFPLFVSTDGRAC
ncbi:MAG: hypothetical protein M3O64_02415 [Chloroflexota bacterium]|nr:hypothetical protein [Chloroflexota bacterium]